jgi:hypothetical protein
MTEVQVGSEKVEKFLVRKDLAIHHSRVIEKALDPENDWKEAEENVVRLPEEMPEAFQAFLTFLETGVVHLDHFKSTDDDDAPMQETLDESAEWENIAEAWLLADRILSVSLKDALVDKVISMVRDHGKVPIALHPDIYRGSAFKSGTRTLLVDIAAYGWSSRTLADQPGDPECAEFFRDVGVEAMKRINYPAIVPYNRKDVGCHYHDHFAEEKPCYKAMFG